MRGILQHQLDLGALFLNGVAPTVSKLPALWLSTRFEEMDDEGLSRLANSCLSRRAKLSISSMTASQSIRATAYDA